jgi:hypothetical protein
MIKKHRRVLSNCSTQCMSFIHCQYFIHLFDCQNGRSTQFIYCFTQSTYSTGDLHLHRSVSMSFNRELSYATLINFSSYIVWYQRGYQVFQEPRGTSVTKVKGVSSVNLKMPSSMHGKISY